MSAPAQPAFAASPLLVLSVSQELLASKKTLEIHCGVAATEASHRLAPLYAGSKPSYSLFLDVTGSLPGTASY